MDNSNFNFLGNANLAEELQKIKDMQKAQELLKLTSNPNLSENMVQPNLNINPKDLVVPSKITENISTPTNIGASLDREAVLQNYKDNLLKRISESQANLTDAQKAYTESQKAGSGWKGGIQKGLSIFADTLSGMAGQKGGYTADVMKGIEGEKAKGTTAYQTALGKEAGYMKELDNLQNKDYETFKIKNAKDAIDPTSKESQDARAFAKDTFGITLPENTNAIQAKVYMDMSAKQKLLQNSESWKQKNYEQRERGIASTQEQKTRLTPTETLKVAEGKAIPDTLAEVKKEMDLNKDLFASTSFKPLAKLSAAARTAINEKEQEFDAKLSAASQQFGRFMEGGVLRTEDEKKYRKMFPNMEDTPDVAASKLANVDAMMRRKQQTDLDALKAQGKSTSGLEFNKPTISPVKNNSLSIGTIKNGYKYLGGNPNDPKSWEKQ